MLSQAADGIYRVTFRLPLGIDHVHCYLVRASDGGYTLVDTGLGLPGAESRWAPVLAQLDAPVERIAITHFHPDHVGDTAAVAELTAAPVYEGRLDHEQCLRTWGAGRTPERQIEHMRAHGLPEDGVASIRAESDGLAALVHGPSDPLPLEPGDELDGWQILHLPGHADGHLAFLRDGVLLAGDAILAPISPVVGLYPDARPDPLGDYLATLDRIAELDPALALTGHHDAVRAPAARARELQHHHRERLEATRAALADEPRSGYDVSLRVFPVELSATQRRFALAETLAHLVRLVHEERAEQVAENGRVFFRAPA